jgi:hypothetical protein
MGLVVSSWRRHGEDRLYVTDDATREGVGFYDHRTGRLTLKDEARTTEVLEALRPFLTDSAARRPPGRAASAPGAGGLARGLGALATIPGKPRTRARDGRVVDKRLGRLRRDGWAVLPQVARAAADAGAGGSGHLVIGQPGVFTVDTHHHPGAAVEVGAEAVKVDGAQQPFLREARHAAAFAERVLGGAVGEPVPVTAVLAFVGAASIDARDARGDVLVLPAEDIDTILRERLAVYSIEERDRVLAAARRPEIWLS